MRASKKLFVLFLFSVAMAFVEAAVVVYLRELYYPEGFSLQLKAIPRDIFAVELGREFSTIVMLITIGVIAGRNFIERFSYFLFCFGIWDIFYYIFLKQTLNWPESLLAWDILFLIPVPWIAPVLAPVLVATTMVIIAVISVLKIEKGYVLRFLKSDWILGFTATLIIFVSFILYLPRSQKLFYPYHWELFILGKAVGLFAFYRVLKRASSERPVIALK